jgi:Tol biopolymer transport system component
MSKLTRSLLVLVVVCAQATTVSARTGGDGGPRGRSTNGRILFEGWGGCVGTSDVCQLSINGQTPSYDIWSSEPDGSGLVNLTASPGVDTDGKWSPDGSQIVFSSNRTGAYQLFLMNADGSGVRQLTYGSDHPSYATWSPDGERIAYLGVVGRRDVVRIIPADGGRPKTVASFDWAYGLAWSPDGRHIALTSRKHDIDRIILMRSDGTHQRLFPGTGPTSADPSWAPNGRRIAFDRCTGRDLCNADIYTVRIDGTGLKRITTDESYEYDPVWSPDGKSIAYSGEIGDDVSYGDIWIVHLDGGPSTSIRKPDTYDYQPDWQPLPTDG